MRYRTALLVNLYYPESGYGERLNFPPVGLGYLSEALLGAGVEHDVVDTGTGATADDVLEAARTQKPALIGVSLNSICYPRSEEVLRRLREVAPEAAIVVGGPHVSTLGAAVLEQNPAVDYGIVREGESALVALVRGEAPENIAGLVYRRGDGAVAANPPTPQDPNVLAFPRYERFDLETRYPGDAVSILTSRGCPFKCAFCQQSALLGKSWRARTPESVLQEIRYWHGRGVTNLHVLDDNFALNRGRLQHIADQVEAARLPGLNLSLISGVRVQNAREDVLANLKRLGVEYLSFGIESGSDRVLKLIQKGCTAAQADDAVGRAVKMGFRVRLFFIIGFPTETREDVERSFALARRHAIYQATFFNLIPYEGTPIMDWIRENDAQLRFPYEEYMSDFKRFQSTPVIEAPGMSVAEKEAALAEARQIAAEIERRRPTLWPELAETKEPSA